MQQSSASQPPIQLQNIARPGQTLVDGNPKPDLQQHVQSQNVTEQGQTSFIENPPPPYYEENLYPHQSYLQDHTKMAYATLPMQPYPTYNLPPPYGGNYSSTPQQVHVIPMHWLTNRTQQPFHPHALVSERERETPTSPHTVHGCASGFWAIVFNGIVKLRGEEQEGGGHFRIRLSPVFDI